MKVVQGLLMRFFHKPSTANHSDAESAVSNLDGYRLEDSQITVEFSKKRDLLGNSCLICNEEGHWARFVCLFLVSGLW